MSNYSFEVSFTEYKISHLNMLSISNLCLLSTLTEAFAMINECDPSIASWTEEGDKFVVKNKDVFAASVIPQYYDHNNYSSFTR